MRYLSPVELVEVLTDGTEYALLDVRERARYAAGHPLLAINLPASRIEIDIRRYVPRPGTHIVLTDAGEGLAEKVAHTLNGAGYTRISVLRDGVRSWDDAGLEVFKGHYAMTYAFGLHVERHYATPSISATELADRIERHEDMVLIDARPAAETASGTIPGAYSVPFSELCYRLRDLAPQETTPMVVHCGAVTRGILGTETLRDANLPNPLVVVTNGVRGWEQAGYKVERGAQRKPGPVSSAALAWAQEARAAVAKQFNIRHIDRAELQSWCTDADRTLFLIDVRDEEEYAAGHVPGSISIVGSELVGLYEDHVGTMNARVCLVDDDGTRATTVASWLLRMGWPDVSVVVGGLETDSLTPGPEPRESIGLEDIQTLEITSDELAGRQDVQDLTIIDFSPSSVYANAHIPGAWWSSRADLRGNLELLPPSGLYVVSANEPAMAQLAARDLGALTQTPVRVLSGGNDAWTASGKPLTHGMTRAAGAITDLPLEFLSREGDDVKTLLAAHRRNEAWQRSLLEKIDRDVSFNFPPLKAR